MGGRNRGLGLVWAQTWLRPISKVSVIDYFKDKLLDRSSNSFGSLPRSILREQNVSSFHSYGKVTQCWNSWMKFV